MTKLRLQPLRGLAGRLLEALHDDSGAAAVSFLLAFPIFLWIVAIVVQVALMANARILVTQAAEDAARSAVTSLPDGQPQNITTAACAALAPVSPKADSTAAQASSYASSLQNLGANVPATYASRYSYAMQATTVAWSPNNADYLHSPGQPVTVTVTYQFLLTVPGVMNLIPGGQDQTIAGVKGRFWQLSATAKAQTSDGRQTQAAASTGWPGS